MRIVVGITGGIAAYKAVHVVRELVLAGADVHVVPTASALKFVGRPTFEAISRNPVSDEVFDDVAMVRHVALGQSADLCIVAPATANSIAKIASGLADDLLGTTLLASRAPLVIAPAMHTEMWEHPATTQNIATLRKRGVTIVGPDSGQLTGSDSGVGRMAEPHAIVESALQLLRSRQDLLGVRVVVSAGGTREPIDPVRFLGNRSSGTMGAAIAQRAAERGATVTLVGANMQTDAPSGVAFVPVGTTAELREVMLQQGDADVIIMAAAVADYRPAERSSGKLKKETWGDEVQLHLVQNPDILRELAHAERSNVVVGFAAETETDPAALRSLAVAKIQRKGCDLLVVNQVGEQLGFGEQPTRIEIIDARGSTVDRAEGTKMSVADAIVSAAHDFHYSMHTDREDSV
ncbi:bifunctional phosphopantothenoylcysteine decarboxylase/phosphopantothenate--cysteine ligase CoaBC [Humidisolicoccus flavus]|uniref:bifunctional phosphopantothenoylcysteine decarboxylase/phosphopantothenate--cysteine ligase CoaBC n=1 Tax=Humidisolicoccus flavus TaxID=3111414 RepID=UPI0032489C51